MNILCVVNKEAWATGTLARLVKLGLAGSACVRIVSSYLLHADRPAFDRLVASSDVVHWFMHRVFSGYERVGEGPKQVVSLYHLDEDETNLSYLARADAVTVSAVRYRSRVAAGAGEAKTRMSPLPVHESFVVSGADVPSSQRAGRPVRIGFFAAADYETDRKGVRLLPAVSHGLTARGVVHEFVVTGLGWDDVRRRSEFGEVPMKHVIVPSYFDMPRLYRGLDAYLCLSSVEGGPMPVFEAAAAMVPVVTTDVGQVPDVFACGVTHVGVEVGDAASAIAGICSVLEAPLAARARCGAAREIVESRLISSEFVRNVAEIYGRITGSEVAIGRKSHSTMIRKWKAWDRSYWAKELWTRGRKGTALGLAMRCLALDPLCNGIWGAVGVKRG